MTSFVVIEGPDGCGKSTLIDLICSQPLFKQIKYPKTMPRSGKLTRFNDERSFELMFTLFEMLDDNYVYVLDRFMVSNLVYDVILRNEDPAVSQYYLNEFRNRFNVLEIYLTRNYLSQDFSDDRISMTSTQFNLIIDEYKKYGYNYHILERDGSNAIVGVNELERYKAIEAIKKFTE